MRNPLLVSALVPAALVGVLAADAGPSQLSETEGYIGEC